jgi:hypothetical protein
MITLTFSDFLAGGMAVRLESSLSDGERPIGICARRRRRRRRRALLVAEFGELTFYA